MNSAAKREMTRPHANWAIPRRIRRRFDVRRSVLISLSLGVGRPSVTNASLKITAIHKTTPESKVRSILDQYRHCSPNVPTRDRKRS
jgi:hypothetical protein